jgi:hypothetical protein
MNPDENLINRLMKGDLSIIFYISFLMLALHLALNLQGGYGLFRDEFYYIACADNLAFGYVDHPPLSIYILHVMTRLFGDSLFVVRFIPALAGAVTVFLTGLITLRLGGKKLAVFLACLFSFSIINQAMFGFYSMNALEILSWTASAYVIILIIDTEKKSYWWILGIILGLALLNKIGVLFLGAGILVGLLATKERKWLTTPWPYIAGIVALILFLPYIIWNIQHDFAHLEFIRNASAQKYSSLSAISFLSGQILNNNPVGLLVWLPGLLALFLSRHFKKYRILGYMYLVPLLILLINGTSKPEYLAPAYGILWAAGSVWWETIIQRVLVLKFVLGAVVLFWIVVSVTFLPIVVPVLPVEKYISYTNFLHFQPESPEGKEQSELHQFYADMFGWKEKTAGVAYVYNTLSDEEKKKVAIFSNNYGRCASIDYYGRKLGLPKTIGNHNNYWVWGTRGHTGEIVIILGGDIEDHRPDFREVKLVTTVDCDYCMPYENHVPVYLCRDTQRSLPEIWKEIKHFE